jgi:hypothetical protein
MFLSDEVQTINLDDEELQEREPQAQTSNFATSADEADASSPCNTEESEEYSSTDEDESDSLLETTLRAPEVIAGFCFLILLVIV